MNKNKSYYINGAIRSWDTNKKRPDNWAGECLVLDCCYGCNWFQTGIDSETGDRYWIYIKEGTAK
jgi:hypothetical protein